MGQVCSYTGVPEHIPLVLSEQRDMQDVRMPCSPRMGESGLCENNAEEQSHEPSKSILQPHQPGVLLAGDRSY